jgi:uncharacterized protein
MGLATLLMAVLAWLLESWPGWKLLPVHEFLRLDELGSIWTLIGIEFGVFFGIVMLMVTSFESKTVSFQSQIELIRSFRLNIVDCVFLSLCAGLGEEFLFRIAVQHWLTPLPTAVLFVAIHGYIHPRDWDVTKYGLLVLAFIIALSYAVNTQGIWFCVAAHASYDLVLFVYWGRRNS